MEWRVPGHEREAVDAHKAGQSIYYQLSIALRPPPRIPSTEHLTENITFGKVRGPDVLVLQCH